LLFQHAAGFPNEAAREVRRIQADAKAGTTEIKLKDLKPGRHAVRVIHDSKVRRLESTRWTTDPSPSLRDLTRMGMETEAEWEAARTHSGKM
jgi:hypothetical protein